MVHAALAALRARTPHITGEVTVRGRSWQPTTGADQWDDILEGWGR